MTQELPSQKPETEEAFSLYNHYLDALYDLTRAEYNARTGLVTRQNQLVVTEKQRKLAAFQQTMVEMWLSLASTRGSDEEHAPGCTGNHDEWVDRDGEGSICITEDDPHYLTEAESGDPEVRFDG